MGGCGAAHILAGASNASMPFSLPGLNLTGENWVTECPHSPALTCLWELYAVLLLVSPRWVLEALENVSCVLCRSVLLTIFPGRCHLPAACLGFLPGASDFANLREAAVFLMAAQRGCHPGGLPALWWQEIRVLPEL